MQIDQETRERLKAWLWQDYVLYDFFRQKFEAKCQTIEKLDEETRKIDDERKRIIEECQIEPKLNKNLLGENKHKFGGNQMIGYSVNSQDEHCQTFGLTEKAFVDLMRSKMIKE